MSVVSLGRLEKVDVRDVWMHEAGDFTPWLATPENLALLGETIGIDLELEAQEQNVGPFRADILCKDVATNTWVLIENQLERTDHTHLGQLLTYAAGLNAVTIVWIADRFMDEHRAALDWLNGVTAEGVNFFGLEIELWRIGQSAPAPKLNVVSRPNDWSKTIGEVTKQPGKLTDIEQKRLAYWTGFREYLRENSRIIKPGKPGSQHWMSFYSLRSSAAYMNAILNHKEGYIRIDVVLNPPDAKQHFLFLHNQKAAIEQEIGLAVDWRELPEKKRSAIELRNYSLNPNNEEQYPVMYAWMCQTLEAFHRVFAPRVKTWPNAAAAISQTVEEEIE